MAELMLKDMVEKLGRAQDFYIESSATSDENIWNGKGAPVYSNTRELLESKGISCAGKRAQQLKKEHGDKFDLFLCMDDNNVRNAKAILGAKNGEKCKKLLSYAGESGNVADPWYTRNFEKSYEDILRGLEGLLLALEWMFRYFITILLIFKKQIYI
jgi:protein-tyrosine phosphatase